MNLKAYFLCLLMILVAGSHSLASQNQCFNMLSRPVVQGPRSLDTLIEKMEDLGIRLELREEIDIYESASQDYFEIIAYDQEGDMVGEISMIPMGQILVLESQERPLYASHIDVSLFGQKSMLGTGLGTYLYASAARAIHRLGGVLFSSTGPSSKAIDAWERMIEAGWAVSGRERDEELSEIDLPQTTLSSYRFNQNLLRNGFFDDLDEVIEDRDMVFILNGE